MIVDDHPLFCEGIRAWLEFRPNIEIVGQAGDGWEGIECARRLHPDILLLDITLPRLNGLAACRLLVETLPQVKVLILTMHRNKEYILEMVRFGAAGYLLKDCKPDELFQAIEAVHRGENFFSPEAAKVLQQDYNLMIQGRSSQLPQLSPREGEVLSLVAQGFPTKQIADHLHLKNSSVVTYRQRIMCKLGIRNIAGLTQFALLHGYLAPSSSSSPQWHGTASPGAVTAL